MHFWSKFPFVRVVIFFILGIVTSIFYPGYQFFVSIGLLISISLFAVLSFTRKNYLIKFNPLYGAVISTIFMFLGYLVLWQSTESNKENHIIHIDSSEYYTARVISAPEARGEFLRAKIEIESVKTEEWALASGKVLAYFRYDNEKTLEYGDQLLVKGFPQRVEGPKNPFEFDYRKYLKYNNIHHQHFVNEEDWIIIRSKSDFSLMGTSIQIRNRLEAILEENIHGQEELAIAKALILGNKEDLDNSTKEMFAKAGAMHVLAVSGLHVGIIYLVLLSLLGQKRMKVNRPVLVAVVVIPTLWLYAFVTGLSPSVLRAVTMFSFLALAQVFGRRSNTLNTLAISAFILLLYNPYMVMTVGFQLSYVAVLGIFYIFPYIERWLNPSNSVIRGVWQLTALSLAAQLATFPLAAFYFHRFPTYFLISNLLVIPAAIVIVWGGLLLLTTGFFSSFLAGIIGISLSFIIGILNSALNFIIHWPFADIQNLTPTLLDSWITYAIIVFTILFVTEKKKLYLRLSTGAIIILSASMVYQELQLNNIRQINIYSIHNRWAIDLVENRQYQSIHDSTLLKENNKIDFHIDPVRKQYNLTPSNIPLKTSKTTWGDVFIWHDKNVLIANACIKREKIPGEFDIIIVKPSSSNWDCYHEQIVLRKLVDDQGVHFIEHNLREEGALIIEI